MLPVSWPERIEISLRKWGNGKVKRVRTMYEQTHQTHGTDTGETQDSIFIDLEAGEVVNRVKLGKGNFSGGMSGVGFIELHTSKNRQRSIGSAELCDEVIDCVPYDGCTGLKGFWGGKGDLIDRLGAIWGK